MRLTKHLHLNKATYKKIPGVIYQEGEDFYFLNNSKKYNGSEPLSFIFIKGYKYSWHIGFDDGEVHEDLKISKEKASVKNIEITPFDYFKSLEDEFCEDGKMAIIVESLYLKLGKERIEEILNTVTVKEARKICKKLDYEDYLPPKFERLHFDPTN